MFHASVTILAASAPWELRVLALKRRYTHMRAWDPAEDSIEQTALNDLGTAEEVAWDQWRSQLINEGDEHRGAEGDMEKPPRPASHLQGDAGAHGAQRVRQVPDENRTRDDGYLSPLRGGQGHGAAHAGFCPARELSRYTLRHVIGERLTPSAIVEAMLSGTQEYEVVRLFCERVMLAKERAERERKRNFHPYKITRWRGMAVRRPRAASSPSQRTATRRGDSARGNDPPLLTPNSTVRELLGLARTRAREKKDMPWKRGIVITKNSL